MRVNMWATFTLAVCLTIFSSLSYSAKRSSPVMVAIVGGDAGSAPSDVVIAKLEVALSQDQNINLVERSLVRKLLAEQKLSAAGLTDASTALRLGQLFSADLFLFLEKFPESEPTSYHIQMIEAKTGISLAGVLTTEKSITEDVSPIISSLKSAIAKSEISLKDRWYVGLLGFRSEEPGHRLDGLVETLGMLLISDLSKSSSIIVLDREHLDRLATEKDLTGIDLKLKTSTVLLDVGMRRIPGKKQLAVTVYLRSLISSKPKLVSVTVPADDLRTAREKISLAVTEKLGAVEVETGDIDSEKEAAIFAQRANILLSHGETETATRAAETAFALYPCGSYRNLVCQAWRNFINKFRPPTRIKGSKKRGFLAAIRVAELSILANEEAIRTHTLEKSVFFLSLHGNFGLYISPYDATDSGLRRELQELCVQIFEIHQPYYWDMLTSEVLSPFDRDIMKTKYGQELREAVYWARFWFEDVTGYLQFVKRLIEKLEKAVELGIIKPREHYEFIEYLATSLKYANDKWSSGPVLPLIDWLTKRQDPLVRGAGYVGKLGLGGDAGVEAAKSILDIYLKELPPDHVYHSRLCHDKCLRSPVNSAIGFFANRYQNEFASYFEPIVANAVENGHAHSLAVWSFAIKQWLHFNLKPVEAYEWTGKILDVLNTASVGKLQQQADLLKSDLKRAQGTFAKRMGKVKPSSKKPWYSITQIKTGPAPVTNRRELVSIYLHDDHMILLWKGLEKKTQIWMMELIASSVPLTGGLQKERGRITFPLPSAFEPVTGVAIGEGKIYVGISETGLIVFEEGETKLWNEEAGLPSNSIESLAWYDGKLYLGLSSAFAEFDPKTNYFNMLASAKRLQKRTPFDGGQAYTIRAILVDKGRKCLWLGISGRKPAYSGDERRGLWKFDSSVKTFTQILKLGYQGISNMTWSGGNIVAQCDNDTILINPENLSQTRLTGYIVWGKPKPIFGQGSPWPVALVGNHLISRSSRFVLNRESDSKDSALLRLIRCVGLCPYGQGVIIGVEGKLWKIEPK